MQTRMRKRDTKKKRKIQEIEQQTYTGWITKVISPATDSGADEAIDSFRLLSYIREQMEENDRTLEICLPNPFAGTKTIDEITSNHEKQIALTTVIQFVHHYARHMF